MYILCECVCVCVCLYIYIYMYVYMYMYVYICDVCVYGKAPHCRGERSAL
jgi:hypothetical protein